MSTLRHRDRRAVWFGALVVVPVLGWRLLVAPFVASIAEAEAKAEATVQLLARELALLRDGRLLAAQLAASRQRLDAAAPLLFVANDTSEATAALAAWCRSTARDARLSDVRTAPAPLDVASEVLIPAAVDITARASTASLAHWLATLEGAGRLVTLERLDVVGNPDGSLSISARARGWARGKTR